MLVLSSAATSNEFDTFMSNLECALSVQTHFRHGHQHLFIDELCLSLRLHLLTFNYQLGEIKGGCANERSGK